MDSCEEYTDRQWLSYLLNRVREEELVEMQYHLATCEACRERMNRMRALAGFLEGSAEKESGIFSSVTFRQVSIFVKRRRWAIGAAVCLFLSAGGYYYWAALPFHKSEIVPVEFRKQPVYESADTLRSFPDSLPVWKEKQNEKK